MKNALSLFAVIGVIILSWFVHSQSQAIKEQQSRLTQLTSSVQERAKIGNLDLQRQCASQAHTQFVQNGWEKEKLAGYVNHYNEKMNSCFMIISSTDTKTQPGRIFSNMTLVDAFEGKVFGNYAWQSDPVKTYWENPPFMCDVTLPSGEKKICKSDAEFKELIKAYMGDMSNQ